MPSRVTGTAQPGSDFVRAAFERAEVPAEEAAGQEVRREQAVLLGDPGHARQR